MAFGDGFGFRKSPCLVASLEAPWASFAVMSFDSPAKFKGRLAHLIELSKSSGNRYFFILGLFALVVLNHPFVDGNGRTMRLVLYKSLVELLRMDKARAAAYASFGSVTKEAFANAFYEVRVFGDFSSFIKMFY
ncbi:MAG: Fic family protein [Rhodanobacter sp.]